MKNRKYERPTACIRNSGFSAKSKVSAFNKSQYQTESEVLFNPLLLIHANRCDAILRYATNRVTSVDGLHPIMYSFHRYRSELRTSSNLLNKKYTQLRCYIFYCRKSVNRYLQCSLKSRKILSFILKQQTWIYKLI